MNPISGAAGNDKNVTSRGQRRSSVWLNDRVDSGLHDQNVASRPSRIRCQTILDTSDSDSDSCEPVNSKSVRSSRPQSISSNTPCGSSTSKFYGPENPRFVPSPHPDMIRQFSSGSESSKFESAESSSSRKISRPSKLPAFHRFDPIRNEEVASIAGTSGTFVPTLQKSRFTHASFCVLGNTKKPLNSASISSQVEASRSGKRTIRQWVSEPSGPVILDCNISRRSDDVSAGPSGSSYSHGEPMQTTSLNFEAIPSSRNVDSQHSFSGRHVPSVSTFNQKIPRQSDIRSPYSRNSPSPSHMDLTANVAANSFQIAVPHPSVNSRSEPVVGAVNTGFPGSQEIRHTRNYQSSRAVQSVQTSHADVVAVNCPGNQQKLSHRAAIIKSEPVEFDSRTVGSSQDRSTMPQNPSQVPDFGPRPVMHINDMRPLNSQQTLLHETYLPEVVFDTVRGISASESPISSRNIQSSLQNVTHRASSSSPSFGHSNPSHLRTNVGPMNKDSSTSSSFVPSHRSYLGTNPRNIASSSQNLTHHASSSSPAVGHSNGGHLGTNVSPRNQDFSSTSFAPSNRSYLNTNPGNSSSNQENPITSESSDSGVVIMSLVHKKNYIAGSSYNSSTGQVHLLESVAENSEFCTTVLALRSVTPDIVVVPTSGATRFVKDLKVQIEGDMTLKDCQFQCISPRYFAYSFARRTVLESSLWEGCLTFRSEDAKKNAIVSNINLNDERLVCAFGGLLYNLSTGCPQLGTGLSPTPISSVQHMKLSHKLWLDTESFKNLQIFDPAEHPSSFKWSSTNRDDGKSIFGLFERNCSSVGMSKLKSFLANPVSCRRTIEKRHEVMNFYLNHNNFNTVEALRSFTSQMSSLSVIMNCLSSPTLRGGHWKHIYRHIYYTVSYAEVCRSHGAHSELFRELGSTIVDSVYSMAHNLEKVVDLVNMENNETFVIKYGFHPPLDAAKEKFSRLKTAMDKVTPYEFDSVPSFITRIQMMYIPEMKFLLSIPYWASDLSKEELILPNLEFKFTANKTAFYKSRRCYELDELLGDAQTDIINEESMIIQSLKNYLKKHMHHIAGMAQKIAEIECIFAMAKVAREERFTRPEILDNCVIDIRGGWHPLLDVPSNEVITNDTVSSADESLVKLIYGPNASGKSIYLKHVGLIMYLVHVGSYVPAVSVRVGLFCRILARTTTEESVISMSSTMLSELKKLQDAVMGCAKDTLVILDEVGKGSTEVNCIAIVTSAINYFLSQGSDCPHVLISTHLSGISDYVTSPPHSDGRNLFELLVMNYTITDGEIVFLYKIRRGSPDGSFVFEVLENSEFAAPIIKTARTVLEALRTGENFLPYCETRIQRSHKYLNFIRKFVNIDMAKPGYIGKLQNKIQRYYEKPSY